MRLTALQLRGNNERAAKPRQAGKCPRARNTTTGIPALDPRSACCNVCVRWGSSHSMDYCACGAVAQESHAESRAPTDNSHSDLGSRDRYPVDPSQLS